MSSAYRVGNSVDSLSVVPTFRKARQRKQLRKSRIGKDLMIDKRRSARYAVNRMIGQGVYTLADVARYTRVARSTLDQWFRSRGDRPKLPPIFKSDHGTDGNGFAVSFLNLIEAHVAAMLKEKGFTPQRIRRAHKSLQGLLHTDHPFAHQSLRIDVDEKYHPKRPNIFTVDGSKAIDGLTKQVMLEYVSPRLNTITYGEDMLAETWEIATEIVIDPWRGFGHPVVKGAGVSTLILAKQYHANRGNASLVAKLFNTTADDVVRAVDYEKSIKRFAA